MSTEKNIKDLERRGWIAPEESKTAIGRINERLKKIFLKNEKKIRHLKKEREDKNLPDIDIKNFKFAG